MLHQEVATLLKYCKVKYESWASCRHIWNLSLTGESSRVVNSKAIPLVIWHVVAWLNSKVYCWENVYIDHRKHNSFCRSWRWWGLGLKTHESWLGSASVHQLQQRHLHGRVNAIWFSLCFLSLASVRLLRWLRSSKFSTSRKKKIGHLRNCAQEGCSSVA